MEPDRKTSGFCKAGSHKRFRLVFFGPGAIPRRARIRRNQTRDPTPHHRPLIVEGRPQPTCLRSVARTARKPPRPAQRAPLTAMPAAPAVHAPRLGPASSAYVLLPAQVSRLRRLPFAAVAHSGCAVCPRGAAHTQSTLWAWPDRSLTRAGRVGSSQRRALRYGRRAAALPCLPASGGGGWPTLAAQWGRP